MILEHQVKWIAESHLREVLKQYPGITKTLLESSKFYKWCKLCTERANQLDLAGYVRSKWAMTNFIQKAVSAYAYHQLTKLGNLPSED